MHIMRIPLAIIVAVPVLCLECELRDRTGSALCVILGAVVDAKFHAMCLVNYVRD
jgi:hypothetical protein